MIGTLPDARDTTEGIKQGMTLIDRFYDGGNMARQGVADILVTVLDQVIGRMRQRNAKAQTTKFNGEMKTLDRGFNDKGVVLPGREVNMRKNPNGPAARKPGDMLKDLKL